MAFPVVEGTSSGADDGSGNNYTITLPANIAAGETIIAGIGNGQTNEVGGFTWPAGWTELLELNVVDTRFSIGWRKAAGGESTVVVTGVNANVNYRFVAYRISVAADPTVTPPEGGTAAGSGLPNPPSLTPTGGAKDYLWLAWAHTWFGETVGTVPTNYTNKVAGTGGNELASARRFLNSASENPGTWGTSVDPWGAATVAVHPASAVARVPPPRSYRPRPYAPGLAR